MATEPINTTFIFSDCPSETGKNISQIRQIMKYFDLLQPSSEAQFVDQNHNSVVTGQPLLAPLSASYVNKHSDNEQVAPTTPILSPSCSYNFFGDNVNTSAQHGQPFQAWIPSADQNSKVIVNTHHPPAILKNEKVINSKASDVSTTGNSLKKAYNNKLTEKPIKKEKFKKRKRIRTPEELELCRIDSRQRREAKKMELHNLQVTNDTLGRENFDLNHLNCQLSKRNSHLERYIQQLESQLHQQLN
eukprot:Awhi_evm1s692